MPVDGRGRTGLQDDVTLCENDVTEALTAPS